MRNKRNENLYRLNCSVNAVLNTMNYGQLKRKSVYFEYSIMRTTFVNNNIIVLKDITENAQ